MGKKLVIVESPAKAKTIERYLGSEYKVTATVGHFRDLPSNVLGVNVKNGYKPLYIDRNVKIKKELQSLAKDSDFVYIATDPDREGEAIAWHVAHVLKIDPTTDCRVTFNEITKKAVVAAIAAPRSIDMDLVNAQQARRVLDRLVGYELSPLLCKKIHRGLSAGRVQSVVTRIVMDRDAQIDAFVPEDYWMISALVSKKNEAGADSETNQFKLKYYGSRVDGSLEKAKQGRIFSAEEANRVMEEISAHDIIVESVTKGKGVRKPAPPFTTSTLQQEASRRLSFPASLTTRIAQQLYEGVDISGQGQTALVTYIRTDSVRISDEAIAASHSLIEEQYGKQFVCPYKRQFKNKNSAQDAHEAIRPSHFELNPESVRKSLTNEQYKLYKLIWERFLASQMADAVTNTVTLDASCGTEFFRAQGETIVFPGFLTAYAEIVGDGSGDDEGKDKIILPEVQQGEVLNKIKTDCEKKQTLPPPHYTEASLIKTMEENGIGRPSTYSKTISTVLERKYVNKEGKQLMITDLGKIVTNMLGENFEQIVDVSFTADMENQLDDVEAGHKDWVDLLSEFYPDFHKKVEEADAQVATVRIEAEKIGEICPSCNKGELVIKDGKNGRFIACSCFPDCNYTRNIEVEIKSHCPLCGSGLLLRKTKKNKKSFFVCDKKGPNPDCEFISWNLPIDGKKCSVCGSYMVTKRFRGKTFPSCGNPDCSTHKKKKNDGEGTDA